MLESVWGPSFISFHQGVLEKKIVKDIQFSTSRKPCWPSWMKSKVIGHDFGRGPSKEYHNRRQTKEWQKFTWAFGSGKGSGELNIICIEMHKQSCYSCPIGQLSCLERKLPSKTWPVYYPFKASFQIDAITRTWDNTQTIKTSCYTQLRSITLEWYQSETSNSMMVLIINCYIR